MTPANAKEAQAMNQYLIEGGAASSTKASVMPGRSRATRWSIGVIAAMGLTAPVVADLPTWLLVADPVTVSNALSTGDAEVILRVIGAALIDILRILAGYL